MSAPTPSVSPELKILMRRLKLGRLLTTLPERLALARTHDLEPRRVPRAALQRRSPAPRRRLGRPAGPGRQAGPPHDPRSLGRDRQDHLRPCRLGRARSPCASSTRPATFSSWVRSGWARHLWPPLSATSPAGGASACTSNGLTACYKRLKAARLDASYDHEMRKLIGVGPARNRRLRPPAARRDRDGRHLRTLCGKTPLQRPTVLTSNRDPSEWLGAMADPLLAQSAIDRLKSAAWELVIEGESYRHHEKPRLESDPSGSPPPPRPPRTYLTLRSLSEII